jgi:hypothetical protein
MYVLQFFTVRLEDNWNQIIKFFRELKCYFRNVEISFSSFDLWFHVNPRTVADFAK